MSDDAAAAPPGYAVPVPPTGHAGYAVPRPRFADQVMGMRGVIAVALACLIIGGPSGFILGHAAARDGRFGRGPIVFQRGLPDSGPNGFPDGPNGSPHQQSPSPDGG